MNKLQFEVTAFDVAEYFLLLNDEDNKKGKNDSGEGITNLKLQKLLYYAQGLYLGLYDEKLFDNEIQAWDNGPVIPDVYYHYKEYAKNPIPVPNENLPVHFRKYEEFLNNIYSTYAIYAGWKLRDLTCLKGGPWEILYKDNAKVRISLQVMEDYFKRIISPALKHDYSPSLKEKIDFCLRVEATAICNPDTPYSSVADNLANNFSWY